MYYAPSGVRPAHAPAPHPARAVPTRPPTGRPVLGGPVAVFGGPAMVFGKRAVVFGGPAHARGGTHRLSFRNRVGSCHGGLVRPAGI